MKPPRRGIPVIDTPRLRLRMRTAEDAAALFPSFADPGLMRYWSGAPHADVAETRALFAEPFDIWRAWAITLRDDDTAIGFVAVGEKRQGNVTELGYLLAREYWGGGIAREAVSAVIGQVFGEGQRRVFADVDPDNAASRALLERLGFKLEGVLRAEWETHLGVRDTTIYGLLREEWNGLAAG